MWEFHNTDLIKAFRKFWYSDEQRFQGVSRAVYETHGGPSPRFRCPTCQDCEWRSRIHQQDLYREHACATSVECQKLCSHQGNDLWTNQHTDFWFAAKCTDDADAPKGLCWFPEGGHVRLWHHFSARDCAPFMRFVKKRLALSCQYEVRQYLHSVNWSKYDFFLMFNAGNRLPSIKRPPLPIIMLGWDLWRTGFQNVLDRHRPEVLLTPVPTAWRTRFKIPEQTEVMFFPPLAEVFYTRPNLGEKSLDLLLVGRIGMPVYRPRQKLIYQVAKLKDWFDVEISTLVGAKSGHHLGPTEFVNEQGQKVRFMNKWSEYLGSARYVMFGPCNPPADEFLLLKYGESLGSGAIPIFPEVRDLEYFGVEPMVHYIPLSEVWQNNSKLMDYLYHYDEFKHIAANAVQWYRESANEIIRATSKAAIQKVIQ